MNAHIPPQVHAYVVDIAGEPFSRKVLATSLQGVVNKKGPRIYILDGEGGGLRPWETQGTRFSQFFWLTLYQERFGLRQEWTGRLDEALSLFAPEVSGYIRVDENEPWTVNAATSLAGPMKALVVFDNDIPTVRALGLPLLKDLGGRWTDAASCYLDTFKNIYPSLSHDAIGILSPKEYRAMDLLIQRNIFTFFGRPGTRDWYVTEYILSHTPQNTRVFGYIADDPVQEYAGVKALSEAGKFLNPSDTSSNLSFHGRMEGRLHPKPAPARYSCVPGHLYVTIDISDGDNLAIPLNYYIQTKNWLSPLRGSIPMGWSVSPALHSLAPAVAEYYLSEVSQNDELIGMLGVGYAHPSVFPDIGFFTRESMAAFAAMGMTSWWQIDPYMNSAGQDVWKKMAPYLRGSFLRGFLLAYYGNGGSFMTAAGSPALIASSTYFDTPDVFAAKISDTVQSLGSNDIKVMFLSASVWSNTYEDILTSFQGFNGNPSVVFLLPSQALDCLRP